MSKDETKKELKNWWALLCVCCLIALGILAFGGYGYYKSEINNLKVKSTVKVSKLNAALVGAKDLLVFKTAEFDKLKRQLSEIKDKNDLLKRDIEFYIDTTHPKVPRVVAKSIAINVVDLSRKYKVSPELIVGIIKVESAFNPMIVGPKTKYGHARGLMQVMPEWSKKLGLKSKYEFHNVDVGIESGIKVFLIHLEEGKGDISTGLYYYVNKDKAYVGKVYAAMGKFVAFRSTIDEENRNVETEIDNNGGVKEIPLSKKGENKVKNDKQ
jgi:hypothetical protein